jgi:hypothetical protein
MVSRATILIDQTVAFESFYGVLIGLFLFLFLSSALFGFAGLGHWKTFLRNLLLYFACLAFQNAMAAQMNGFTIHHWSGIPARNLEGEGTGDAHKQSIKCQALRVVIIDEISMVAAELLGTLEYVFDSCESG